MWGEWHRRGGGTAHGFRAGRRHLPKDRQNGVSGHLLRKIAAPWEQVKNELLAHEAGACSIGQVLANSQRWVKFERHAPRPFAMLSVGSIVFRECYGCPCVWAKYC